MTSTRRRHVRPAPDDPRLPRRMRQDSGVNLMHEEDWYGFNVADKMPTRGDSDPALNPFTGLPGTILEVNSITGVEIAPNEVDTPHLKTAAVNTDKLAGTSVSTGKLQDQAATADKIAKNAHGIDPLGTANQNDDPLRAISGDHVKTKTLEGFHLKDDSIGPRVITGLGLDDIAGSLGPGRVPGLGKLNGKIKAHSQIDFGNTPSIPPNAVKDGYDYRRLDHKPNLKKFLTRSDFRADGTLKR